MACSTCNSQCFGLFSSQSTMSQHWHWPCGVALEFGLGYSAVRSSWEVPGQHGFPDICSVSQRGPSYCGGMAFFGLVIPVVCPSVRLHMSLARGLGRLSSISNTLAPEKVAVGSVNLVV